MAEEDQSLDDECNRLASLLSQRDDTIDFLRAQVDALHAKFHSVRIALSTKISVDQVLDVEMEDAASISDDLVHEALGVSNQHTKYWDYPVLRDLLTVASYAFRQGVIHERSKSIQK